MKCSVLLAAAIPLWAQTSVLTYQYDNNRAGANTHETILTPQNVSSAGFGKIFTQPVDGQLYGQPLLVPQLSIPGKGTHNVVYVATEHDSVYAFDADAKMDPLWQVTFLGSSATTVPSSDTGCGQIAPEIGITSTPVIDPQSRTLYLVAMTKESGQYVHRLHALDLATGTEKGASPAIVQATYPGTGEGGTTLTFNPKNYKQRPGLLLLNGIVYTSWSSHCDIGAYHGWLIGYDAQTLKQVSIYNNTPNGNEGSFWAGGAAPAADSAGNIYLVSGNGAFDDSGKGSDLGESFIKLSTSGGVAVADWFTPFNYASLNSKDLDTGSAGVAFLGDEAGSMAHPHLMAGAGKEGRIYLLDRDSLGKLQTGADSQIVQSIPGVIGGLFGNPAYFAQKLYFCGSGDALKIFPVSNAQMATGPASQSASKFAFPGCVPSISANGTANGIVWVLEASGNLHAYDASNAATELFKSNVGAYVKFSVPTVANGKVYAGSETALNVFGLTATAVNAASGEASALAPGSIFSLYGTGLAQSTASANGLPLPLTLGGASVTVNGVPAPLFYASPMQINAQIPDGTATGSAGIAVTVAGVTVRSSTQTIRSAAPGIFLIGQNHAAALNQDGSVNSPSQPAASGSVIAVYLTGLGTVTSVTATVGGKNAAVQYAGSAPGFVGLSQVNLTVPTLAAGDYPLQIAAAGATSNSPLVSIH
jgi:uncharacterized protein (TIGR03437 family)